jgi:hypothetical protein
VNETAYTPKFFSWALERTRTSAEEIVPLVIDRVGPRSVVDLGCGVGIWLNTFARLGIDDYLGVDGPWVPREALQIPTERFLAAQLDKQLRLGRRFDLAVALEVAEHLPEHRANRFIRNLTDHAVCVLFSAAIPHQGGTDHVNEQWPDYWATRFAEHGYVAVDAIRPLIWSNAAVLPFYRQNILIFATPDFVATRPSLMQDRERTVDGQLALVHPELMTSIASNPGEHVLRRSARELMLGELLAALPTVVARSARWRLASLTRRSSRRPRRDSLP